jgi:putative transposase
LPKQGIRCEPSSISSPKFPPLSEEPSQALYTIGKRPAGSSSSEQEERSIPPLAYRAGICPQRRTLASTPRDEDLLATSSKFTKEGDMNDDDRTKEALFRHAILGELLSRDLKRGELRRGLAQLSLQTFEDSRGRPRRMAHKTLEEWLYKYRRGGFEALKPQPRIDQGHSRVLTPDLEQLVVDLKREDPGRSAPLILRELELAGRLAHNQVDVCVIQRLLRRRGLSGPKMELDRPARYRWEASMCGELWQGDALHGPILINPATGRPQRGIIFGLIDDRSRIIPYLEAGFGETEHRFLTVLYNAIARRGIVRSLLLDNHASFSGHDLRVLCATLNIRLIHARPGDGPGKGKIERWWRGLRANLIDRLDLKKIVTLDELNLRLWSYVEGEYHNRPHASLAGRTPIEVWESGVDDIRWPSDPTQLERAFYAETERTARNDSTILWRGVSYEVPCYLRTRKLRLRYSLLDTTRISALDANVEIPLRPVNPTANAHRSRSHPAPIAPEEKPITGLNAPELMLDNFLHPSSSVKQEDPETDAGEGGNDE